MAINFHPKPGTVLMCNYAGFNVPEMIKRRQVIVVSSYQLNNKGLCTIVPISTTIPEKIEPHHFLLPVGKYKFLHREKDCWVKCDMIARVGFFRLDRLKSGGGYAAPRVEKDDLERIRKCIVTTLDFKP